MNSDYKLTKLEAIIFILIVIVNKIILNLPKEILKATGTGAVVNILAVGIIALLFVIILSYLFKKFQNEDIIDISEYLRWKAFKSNNFSSIYRSIYANKFNNINEI
ncbi:MAG: GerAB/ArcD/ProY family transporter [Clostridia bacterium]|nr:GerAB/ArcD/ProY family transporter [Clostridia bacterium]